METWTTTEFIKISSLASSGIHLGTASKPTAERFLSPALLSITVLKTNEILLLIFTEIQLMVLKNEMKLARDLQWYSIQLSKNMNAGLAVDNISS